MQTYTPKQLRSAVEAGGIEEVTIVGRGAHFYVQVMSRRGEGILTKARSRDPRAFRNAMQAVIELRRLGISTGAFDMTEWVPGECEAGARPDRARAMNELHEVAEHGRWVRRRVKAALMEAADPATEWIDQSVIEADSDAQRQRLKERLKHGG